MKNVWNLKKDLHLNLKIPSHLVFSWLTLKLTTFIFSFKSDLLHTDASIYNFTWYGIMSIFHTLAFFFAYFPSIRTVWFDLDLY